MGWRETLRKASYKGIEFNVTSASTVFGRRVHQNEYPYKDKPFAEDLGKKSKEISFEFYLQGDDYITQRNALIRAVEEKAIGTLVHPSFGEMKVRATESCSFNFDGKKGGIETGSLSFIEAGESIPIKINEATPANVEAKYEKLKITLQDVFNAVYTMNNLSGFIKDSVNALAGDYIKKYKLIKRIGEKIASKANKFKEDLSDFELNLNTFIPEGEGLDTQMINLNDSFGETFTNDSDKYEAMKKLNDFTPVIEDPVYSTPTRIQEKENLEIVRTLMKIVSVSEMAVASVNQDYTSSDDLFARKIALNASMNAEIEQAGIEGNEQLRRDLIDLRSITINTLNTKGALLPNEQVYKVDASTPSYTLANKLYGDGARFREIVDQNKILNPLFLPPQTEIKVLSF